MNASELIDKHISELPEWQGKLISRFRKLVLASNEKIQENWKWSTPVWSGKKMIAATGAFKDHVKFNFFLGSEIKTNSNLFNSGLDSKKHRGIDIKEGENFDEAKLKTIILEAIKNDGV